MESTQGPLFCFKLSHGTLIANLPPILQCFNADGSQSICCPGQCPGSPGPTAACGGPSPATGSPGTPIATSASGSGTGGSPPCDPTSGLPNQVRKIDDCLSRGSVPREEVRTKSSSASAGRRSDHPAFPWLKSSGAGGSQSTQDNCQTLPG